VLEAARALPDVESPWRRNDHLTVGGCPGFAGSSTRSRSRSGWPFSLHAPTDELRSELMPVNERYPLADVIAECARYFARRRRKVFVEYVMLRGVNDRVEQAARLPIYLTRRSSR